MSNLFVVESVVVVVVVVDVDAAAEINMVRPILVKFQQVDVAATNVVVELHPFNVVRVGM